ncbi:protein of unknown function [Tenacibaculum sp. 190524A02b]|uniref:LytTR family transcriptional regulator DNA-binding domain-containing protein n=1 Tax=Tenacibaculum vairaonense TaxID=3137860 RepID=UPI0032B237DA
MKQHNWFRTQPNQNDKLNQPNYIKVKCNNILYGTTCSVKNITKIVLDNGTEVFDKTSLGKLCESYPFLERIKKDVVINLNKIFQRQDYNVVWLNEETKFNVSRRYRDNLKQHL